MCVTAFPVEIQFDSISLPFPYRYPRHHAVFGCLYTRKNHYYSKFDIHGLHSVKAVLLSPWRVSCVVYWPQQLQSCLLMHLNLNMFPTVAPNGISVIASVSIPQLQIQFTIDKTTNVALYL